MVCIVCIYGLKKKIRLLKNFSASLKVFIRKGRENYSLSPDVVKGTINLKNDAIEMDALLFNILSIVEFPNF